MRTRPLPDDVRERAERIKFVTDRMIRLGQQLLVLARADSSTRPQDSFRRLDLCEWVRVSRSEVHTSDLQSLMRISYAVFCLKKKKKSITHIKSTVLTTTTISPPQ